MYTHNFYSHFEPRYWTDELSIDKPPVRHQEDREEVSSQIQLMGDIYRCANRVVIWLGEDVEFITYDSRTERDVNHVADLLGLLRDRPESRAGKEEAHEAGAALAAELVDCLLQGRPLPYLYAGSCRWIQGVGWAKQVCLVPTAAGYFESLRFEALHDITGISGSQPVRPPRRSWR